LQMNDLSHQCVKHGLRPLASLARASCEKSK